MDLMKLESRLCGILKSDMDDELAKIRVSREFLELTEITAVSNNRVFLVNLTRSYVKRNRWPPPYKVLCSYCNRRKKGFERLEAGNQKVEKRKRTVRKEIGFKAIDWLKQRPKGKQ